VRKTTARIIECAREMVARSGGTIEGVGVSLPGLVDQETGTALFIPHFKWRDWDVAGELKGALGLSVNVDNDANAAALAELWFGRPEIREVRDFIIVLVEEGAAGSRGCWEAFSSQRAALARYEQSKPEGAGRVDFKQLIDLALSGDTAARTALKETAHYLGVGIANLTQGLSPEAVIVGGPIVRAWPLIVGDIKAVVAEGICRGLPPAHILASSLGEQPTLMGALSLVLTTKFTHIALA
jgi:predicted NBD/HSP70 family sugar kinase